MIKDDKIDNYDDYTVHDIFELINNISKGKLIDEYEKIIKNK